MLPLTLDGVLFHHGLPLCPKHLVRLPWQFAGTHLYFWMQKGIIRIKHLAQEHNLMTYPGLEAWPLEVILAVSPLCLHLREALEQGFDFSYLEVESVTWMCKPELDWFYIVPFYWQICRNKLFSLIKCHVPVLLWTWILLSVFFLTTVYIYKTCVTMQKGKGLWHWTSGASLKVSLSHWTSGASLKLSDC